MSKRRLPTWLYCDESFERNVTPLYKLCWLKAVENNLFSRSGFHWTYYRKCFPEFEVEYTTTFCLDSTCDLVTEPHTHVTSSHNYIFYSSRGGDYFDTIELPDYIDVKLAKTPKTDRKGTSCKRRLFD